MKQHEVSAQHCEAFAEGCEERRRHILDILDAWDVDPNGGVETAHRTLEMIAVRLHDQLGDAQMIGLSAVAEAASGLHGIVCAWQTKLDREREHGPRGPRAEALISFPSLRGWIERLAHLSARVARGEDDGPEVRDLQNLRLEFDKTLAELAPGGGQVQTGGYGRPSKVPRPPRRGRNPVKPFLILPTTSKSDL